MHFHFLSVLKQLIYLEFLIILLCVSAYTRKSQKQFHRKSLRLNLRLVGFVEIKFSEFSIPSKFSKEMYFKRFGLSNFGEHSNLDSAFILLTLHGQ